MTARARRRSGRLAIGAAAMVVTGAALTGCAASAGDLARYYRAVLAEFTGHYPIALHLIASAQPRYGTK